MAQQGQKKRERETPGMAGILPIEGKSPVDLSATTPHAVAQASSTYTAATRQAQERGLALQVGSFAISPRFVAMQFAEGRAGLGDILSYAPDMLSQTDRFGEQLALLVQNMMSDPVASVRLSYDPSEAPANLGAFNAPELLPRQGGASIKSVLDGLQKSHTLYEQAAAQTQVSLEAGSYATEDSRHADLQRYLAFLSSAQGCIFAQLDILVGLQKDRGARIDFLANANQQGVSTELLSEYFKWKADSAFSSARNLYGDRTLVAITGGKSTYLDNRTFVSDGKFLAVKNEWDNAASVEYRKDAALHDWIEGNFDRNESLNKECGEFLAKLQGSIQRRLNEGVIVDGVQHPATVDSPLFGSVSANTANMWGAIGHASLAGLALSFGAATAPIGGWAAAAGFLVEKGYFTSVAATQYDAGDKLGGVVFLAAIWAGPLAGTLGALKVSRGIIYPIAGAGMASGAAVGTQMAASMAGTIGDMQNYGFTPEGIVSIAEAGFFTAGAIHGYGKTARNLYAAGQMGKAAAARLKNLRITPLPDSDVSDLRESHPEPAVRMSAGRDLSSKKGKPPKRAVDREPETRDATTPALAARKASQKFDVESQQLVSDCLGILHKRHAGEEQVEMFGRVVSSIEKRIERMAHQSVLSDVKKIISNPKFSFETMLGSLELLVSKTEDGSLQFAVTWFESVLSEPKFNPQTMTRTLELIVSKEKDAISSALSCLHYFLGNAKFDENNPAHLARFEDVLEFVLARTRGDAQLRGFFLLTMLFGKTVFDPASTLHFDRFKDTFAFILSETKGDSQPLVLELFDKLARNENFQIGWLSREYAAALIKIVEECRPEGTVYLGTWLANPSLKFEWLKPEHVASIMKIDEYEGRVSHKQEFGDRFGAILNNENFNPELMMKDFEHATVHLGRYNMLESLRLFDTVLRRPDFDSQVMTRSAGIIRGIARNRKSATWGDAEYLAEALNPALHQSKPLQRVPEEVQRALVETWVEKAPKGGPPQPWLLHMLKNASAIAELEGKRPGATAALYRQQGISFFGRYDTKTLISQYDNIGKRELVGKRGSKPKPLFVVLGPYTDHNGAFYETPKVILRLQEDFDVRITEAGKKKKAAVGFNRITRKYGLVSAVLLEGHGTRRRVKIGHGKEGELYADDFIGTPSIRNRLVDDATVIFGSCSTGAKKGIVERTSTSETYKGITFLGPAAPTSLKWIYTQKAPNRGKLKFEVVWEDRSLGRRYGPDERAPKQRDVSRKRTEEDEASPKLRAPLPQTGGGYKLGCIFRKLKGKSPKEMEADGSRNKNGWDFDNTPLSDYASATFHFPRSKRLVTQTYFNFEEYLEGLISARKKAGITEPLSILDIGPGTGKQWPPFLEKHGESVSFAATTLKGDKVDPSIEPYVKIGDALRVPYLFQPNTFDVVVARHSMYGQELAGVEGALFVLKVGGEAIIAGLHLDGKLPRSRMFEVIKKDEHPLRANFYHLRKLKHPATERQQLVDGGKLPGAETAKIKRDAPKGTYFEKALLESQRLKKLGFSVVAPELSETQLWRLTRAASRAADKGIDAVIVGHNRGLGELTQNHVGFAQGYSLIAQTIPREYLETPKGMLKYLVAEKASGYAKRGFFSDFTLAMHGNEVAGVITGAIIRIGNDGTMLFTGYRIVRDTYRGKGVSHMLMNAAIERSVRELGIEPSYLVGEAEGPKEIGLAKGAGKFLVRGIDYRQANLENMAGSVFVNCKPLALMLGMRRGNERISFQELHEVVKRLYEYYGLRGERLADFLAKTFANVPQNTEWVRNPNGEFVPR